MNLQKLSIGEFSRLCGVTVKTLRHYEKIGLLQAEKTDRYTGYRYYSVGQLQKMLAIRQLKELGFSLEDIASLFRGSSHLPRCGDVGAQNPRDARPDARSQQPADASASLVGLPQKSRNNAENQYPKSAGYDGSIV